jgi:hypothetical protein
MSAVEPTSEKIKRMRLYYDIYRLVSMHGVLEQLRQGQISHAIEFCEQGLDYGASSIWHQLKNADEFQKEACIASLKRIKNYRQQWPRQVLPVPFASEKETLEISEDVRKILAGL